MTQICWVCGVLRLTPRLGSSHTPASLCAHLYTHLARTPVRTPVRTLVHTLCTHTCRHAHCLLSGAVSACWLVKGALLTTLNAPSCAQLLTLRCFLYLVIRVAAATAQQSTAYCLPTRNGLVIVRRSIAIVLGNLQEGLDWAPNRVSYQRSTGGRHSPRNA